MKKIFYLLTLFQLPATQGIMASVIPPEFEVTCKGLSLADGPVALEMNLIQEKLHPMAGVHLFGIVLYRLRDTDYFFSMVAHPYYNEFTFTGSFHPAPDGIRAWEVSLKASGQIFYEKETGTSAQLTLTKEPFSPFEPPEVEKIDVLCHTKDLR